LILVTGSSIYNILVSNEIDGPTVPGVIVINLSFVSFQVATPMFIDMSWMTTFIVALSVSAQKSLIITRTSFNGPKRTSYKKKKIGLQQIFFISLQLHMKRLTITKQEYYS
jgi:hypothetical protein